MKNFKDKKADMEFVYKTADNLNLPMQVFFPNSDIHSARTILFIHGGGWTDAIQDNSPWNGGWMGNNARYFAEKGFVTIAISYRSLLISENLSVRDLLDDCIDAIQYAKSSLKFVNFEDIIYIGDSAGGYLVTMLGLSQNDEIRPHAVVSLNPVLDGFEDKRKYGFCHCDVASLTPIKLVGEKCAEFLFMYGTADTIVETRDIDKLHEELLKHGHKSDLIKIPDAQHAFFLYDFKYPDEYVTEITEQVLQYIREKF